MERLLAYQGPVVHVDHSHRAPRPTGQHVRTVLECQFYLEFGKLRTDIVPYTLSTFDSTGRPRMTMDDLQAVADELYRRIVPDGLKVLDRDEVSIFDGSLYSMPVDPYKLERLVLALERGWDARDGPRFAVERR